MGFLDKAKAAAEKVAAEASKGAAQVQDKVQAAQTKKKADDLASQLGYLIVRERSGGEAAGPDADRLVAEIRVLQEQLAADAAETPAKPEAPAAPPQPEVPAGPPTAVES